MTRYCAATCCKNRGGQATGTQRKDTSELELTLKEGTHVKNDIDTLTSQDCCPNITNTLSHGFDTDEYVDFDCKQVHLKNRMDGITVSDNKPKYLYFPKSNCETQPRLITPTKFCQICPENVIVSSVADLNCQNNQVCFELQTDQNYVAENVATFQLDHYSDSKIAVLEAQENATLSRLQSLESVFTQLKQENLLSDEKLKILENCCSRVDIAII
ncbi:hypothetical protein XELAEV_18017615mg [Xenopus laevis]|uniref:Uncharacterized protein n=1 Tax=Xenopus laevis TaxID=8355 RepID=A0A974DBU5_XENLA|nr:hypothetical protein XELAEV_18017615mg [Xenopus laevis]